MRILTQENEYLTFTDEDVVVTPVVEDDTASYQISLSRNNELRPLGVYESLEYAKEVINDLVKLHSRQLIVERMLYCVAFDDKDLETLINKQIFIMPQD